MLYEYSCNPCGTIFEMIRPMSESDKLGICPVCSTGDCVRIPSLPVMRPDNLWMGRMTSQGYFTSSSQFDKTLKRKGLIEIGDRTDREGVQQMAESARKSREERQHRAMRKVFEKAFGPEGHAICDSNDGPDTSLREAKEFVSGADV